MKKILTAAILSVTSAGVSAMAADRPTPATQPAVGKTQVFILPSDGKATTQPIMIDGGTLYLNLSNAAGMVRATGPGGEQLGADRLLFLASQKMEKAAWLGVSSSNPQQVLLKQLKIKSGLVVNQVEPKSPAESAGLKVDDVIEKLDDQLLMNPAQFASLIRLHNPGDSVTLTILHEGQRTSLTAKLVEHEVLAMEDQAGQGGPAVENATAMGLLPGILQVGEAGKTTIQIPDAAALVGAFPQGLNARASVFVHTVPDDDGHVQMQTQGGKALTAGFESEFADGTNRLTVVHRDKQKILIIRDYAGKQLFEGPIDTAEQQAKIPAELQDSFQAMQKMAEMSDKIGLGVPPKR